MFTWEDDVTFRAVDVRTGELVVVVEMVVVGAGVVVPRQSGSDLKKSQNKNSDTEGDEFIWNSNEEE